MSLPSISPPSISPSAISSPLRIGILDTASVPLPQTHAKYGNWSTICAQHLLAGADALGLPRDRLQISKWDVVNGFGDGLGGEYPALEDVDALLVTGSRYSVYETIPWITRLIEFIRHVLLSESRVRVIGSCFGHQVVAAALGAPVARNPLGWEVSICEIDLTEVGKELMEGKDHLSIFQLHKDNVLNLPSSPPPPFPIHNLGSSRLCSLQGLYARGRLITTQAHPEMDAEILGELLEHRHQIGIIDQETFEEAMGRMDQKHDGLVVAKAFLRVCFEDQ